MGFLSKLDRSADLVNGIAARVGADLAEAIRRNPEIEALKYRRMVLHCSTCIDQDGCSELQRSSAHLDQTPDYCENKTILDAARSR